MRSIIVFIIISFINTPLKAKITDIAQESDSIFYYSDFSELLTLKPYLLFKLNTLEIKNQGEKLSLSPNSPLGIGISMNYKFAGLAIGFGLPHSQNSLDKYGKTQRLDLQVSLFRKSLGLDAHFQLYKGYYLENPEDFMEWNKSFQPQIPGMRTIAFGSSVYYVFNNERYSNKAAVLRTQIQEKSAGSFVTGLFFSYDEADSPNGFVPEELPDTVATDFDLKAFRYFSTGVNIGYAYTFVFSKYWFINGSVISGGGYKDVRVTNNSGIGDIERRIHGQVLLRAAIGYEHPSLFAGLSISTLIRNMQYNSYDLDLATEQIRFYVGKRFNGMK